MTNDELMAALIEDPDSLSEDDWQQACAVATANPARLRRFLVMDELLGRAFDPARVDLFARIQHRLEHPVASKRFATAVMKRRLRLRRRSFNPVALVAFAAALACGIGIWMWSTQAEPRVKSPVQVIAPLCRIIGSGDVRRGNQIETIAGDSALFSGDVVTAAAGGATVHYEDHTTLTLADGSRLSLLASDERAGKRAELQAGTLKADVAPQPHGRPLMIATPHAEVTVIGTAFTLACEEGRTRLGVEHGRVRLTRLLDDAAVEVAAGEFAVAAAGMELKALSEALLNVDFEDGSMPPQSIGNVTTGPARPGNRACIAGTEIAGQHLTRVMLVNEQNGLFTYASGSDLTFDYWVDERVENLSVYLWNRTQQASMGRFELYPPELVKGAWGTATAHLADFEADSAHLQDGDLVTEITIQTGAGAAPIFIDNVRVVVSP